MNFFRSFFFLILLALAAGDLRASSPAPTPGEVIGSRAPTAILRTMPSDTPSNQRLAGLHFVAGYEVIGEPAPLTGEQSARLLAAIKSPAACDAAQNDEHMRPGVAYRFGSASDAVDLLVCFSCDKIAVVPTGAESISTIYHITQATRDVLLGIAKDLLPKDEAIQELPRVRSEHPVPPPPVPMPNDLPRAGQPPAPGASGK